MPACHNCRSRKGVYCRGLCRVCYAMPKVRLMYPTNQTYGRKLGHGVSGATAKPPKEPTKNQPGSEERLAELEAQAKAGHGLFHRDDREQWTRRMRPCSEISFVALVGTARGS
jgi:hypothetical protein